MNDEGEIDPREVSYSSLSQVDQNGRVFFWRGRVLRAVPAAAADLMRARLASGIVEACAARGLMPGARLTELRLAGAALVVEHERIPVVTYPYEWSYGMLRAAAAAVLEINQIANEAGWELADCHAFNVLFDGVQPKFVDLGSLMPRRPGQRGWMAIEEFVRSYEYSLQLWRSGAGFFARRMLAAAEFVPHADYFACRHPWLARLGAADHAGQIRKYWYLWRRLSGARPEDIRLRLSPGRAALALWLQRQSWLPFQSVPCGTWRGRLLAKERRRPRTMWGGYQDTFSQPTDRFQRIIEIVRELRPATILELAGNQGWLSARLGALPDVRRVTCTDADEGAVDVAYAFAQKSAPRLNVAVLDFIYPLATSFGTGPIERLRSEAVLALAVAHHVLLSQKVPVERLLASIAAYAEKFVLIEFMPLGLWDGHRAPPVPDWYTRSWFRSHFLLHFNLRHEEQLEENRILFVGEVRPGGQGPGAGGLPPV